VYRVQYKKTHRTTGTGAKSTAGTVSIVVNVENLSSVAFSQLEYNTASAAQIN
jgi:hypothetical protein